MNSLVFGGIDSSTYGIYISGEGVWDAPQRDAETIRIPGRNGEYVLDHGNFKNIVVTYPAFNHEASYENFRTKVDNFRNAISSLKGYQRLTDSFHPDEYRMAAFIGGLEVDPILYNDKSMEMKITFNCKPQRFLTSGETQSSVTSGGTITNPTLFESHPLLLVDGYGTLNVNGEPITIQQGALIGETDLEMTRGIGGNASTGTATLTANNLTSDLALSGDDITLGVQSFTFRAKMPTNIGISSFYVTSATSGTYSQLLNARASNEYYVIFDVGTLQNQFSYGTSATHSETLSVSYELTPRNGAPVTSTATFAFSIAYNGAKKFTITCTFTPSGGTALVVDQYNTNPVAGTGVSYVDSTKSALGQLYIDLDIGECYRIENGEYISINTATTLPADLPTFKPGSNTITYDNTFTSFKVTPRWWRV